MPGERRTALHGLRLVCALLAASAMAAPAPRLVITPNVVRMGAFYSGAQVRIEGFVSAGSEAVVVVRGPDTEEFFNRKGRVGPIWVNVGKVSIAKAPSLFLSFSREPVKRLLAPEWIAKYKLTETEIKRQMQVEPAKLDQEKLRADYLALKSGQGVYRVADGGLKMAPPEASGTSFAATLDWPKRAPPDRYEVQVYECRDGAVVARAAMPLEVVRAGFAEMVGSLAAEHDSMYGVIAVIVAILAGFGIDFLASMLRRRNFEGFERAAAEPGAERRERREAARRGH
jgi:uncharacterized protein (TIGR02186 family)